MLDRRQAQQAQHGGRPEEAHGANPEDDERGEVLPDEAAGARRSHEELDGNPAEPYRIGFFSESYSPVRNGVSISMHTLIAALRVMHHHVVVFAPAHHDQPEAERLVLRFPSFVSVFNREYPLAYPFMPRFRLAPYFRRLRLDVVHTHTPFVLGLTGANLALTRGVPLVSTFHTLYSQYTHYVPFLPETITQGILEHYLPWYYNRCAEIICPSELAARTLRDTGVETSIEVIPTGVPIPQIDRTRRARAAYRAACGLPADAPVILYAGRLAREKSVETLIEMLPAIRTRVPGARLALTGAGPHEEALRELARDLALADCVHFLGSRPRDAMDAIYAGADVFSFPSTSETQGLVVAEARAAGTPSVVVDEGGAPETVEEGEDGFLVPAGDREAFVDATVRILADAALRRRMSACCLRRAQLFTPERMAARVLEVYERARGHPLRPATALGRMLEIGADWETIHEAMQKVAPSGRK
jgi:glycosyltransferase involved in cell wall biosynthesis